MSQQTVDAWDRIAPGYDRTNTPTQMWLGQEGLRRADVRAGMRFLDVAAGSGALSIPAARLGAQVLATDQSPVMLELLQRRARREGLDVETRVMDGHALDLDDDSFDLAGSQFGVMLFPDMPRGIREMTRVVRPGGRVLMNVLGDPSKVEFFAFFVRGIRAVRPDFDGPPMDPPPLPFQLRDPERLRQELGRAGLKDVRIHDLRHMFASTAVGPGLPMIGKLLGHTQVQTTARYAHLASDPVKSAADSVSSTLQRAMGWP